MNDIRPKEITANKKTRELVIVWNDQHTSYYPFTLLRNACPCEICRGGHAKMSEKPPREVFFMAVEEKPANTLATIEGVGAYGIAIHWEDGHRFGIYNWHYLKALCPCPTCLEKMDYGE